MGGKKEICSLQFVFPPNKKGTQTKIKDTFRRPFFRIGSRKPEAGHFEFGLTFGEGNLGRSKGHGWHGLLSRKTSTSGKRKTDNTPNTSSMTEEPNPTLTNNTTSPATTPSQIQQQRHEEDPALLVCRTTQYSEVY